MKAVVISDLHLDQSTAGVDRFPDGCAVIEQALAHAIQHNVDAFIFTGDLTDPHTVRAHRSVAKLAEMRRRMYEHGIVSVALAGNHDVIEDGSGGTVLDALKWDGCGPVLTRPDVVDLRTEDGHFICSMLALPFTPTSHNYDPDAFVRAAESEEVQLVIGHLNIAGIAVGSETTDMPRGRDVFWPIAALDECYPNALRIGGHYHTPQVFQGVHIVGSAVRQTFAEKDNDPGFIMVEF